MEGAPSRSCRIVKVERSFEWSRLECEFMTSAYEHVLPIGRLTRSTALVTEREDGGYVSDASDGIRTRSARGA